MADIEKYVTSNEASELIGRTARAIAQLCQDGKMPGAKKIAKTWMIPRDVVLSYAPGPRGPKSKKDKLAAEREELLAEVKGNVT